MELYLRWLEQNEMQPGEESPLGLLLCTEGSSEQIELLQLDKLPKSKGSLVVYILDKNPELEKMVEHIASDKQIIPYYL